MIFWSCSESVENKELEVTLEQVYFDYNILDYKQFLTTETVYKPSNVTFDLLFQNKTDSALTMNLTVDSGSQKKSFYWVTNLEDSIPMVTFQNSVKLAPNEIESLNLLVAYNSMRALKDVLEVRNLDSIVNNLRNFSLIHNLERDRLFATFKQDSTKAVFIFSDTTLIYSFKSEK